jgi:hypothetical protein
LPIWNLNGYLIVSLSKASVIHEKSLSQDELDSKINSLS